MTWGRWPFCLKTIAAFLNTAGGTLLVGVKDDGTIHGIADDGFPNEDKMGLHLVNLINTRMRAEHMFRLKLDFQPVDGHTVLAVYCHEAHSPVYLKDGNDEKFYIRTGPSTTELSVSQVNGYISSTFD